MKHSNVCVPGSHLGARHTPKGIKNFRLSVRKIEDLSIDVIQKHRFRRTAFRGQVLEAYWQNPG